MRTMVDAQGNQTNSLSAMKECVVDYFCDLNITFEDAISPEMFARLRCFPTLEEIRLTLLCMPRGKAPGLDGVTVEVLVHD